MIDDPLTGLVSRALGVEIERATSSPLGEERERVSFVAGGAERSLILERFPADDSLPVRLLPFLARKTDRVPAVHARGEPHVRGAAHWLLREDTGEQSACESDPSPIVGAKFAVERAVASDMPALRALRVPERDPSGIVDDVAAVAGEDALGEARTAARWLRRWPLVLCHGDLRCANAVMTERGVVLTGWERAHIGCGLLDVVRLAADLAARGHAILGVNLPKRYAEEADVPLTSETLRAAELIDRLARRHLRV